MYLLITKIPILILSHCLSMPNIREYIHIEMLMFFKDFGIITATIWKRI